ncbi:hypothetical protein EVAR_92659_1 [Eumeta japonica]|uniref:Uncharacterized protein n=1 Tax=Eumeta variegata TaxID=151549 RepID=A0A4C1SXR6_EUMVA|nr:hypothetical protein EVAR_92659_1 [Eumeta japonica]
MWCPRSREAGTLRVARGGQLLQTVPERPSVAAWALVYHGLETGERRPGLAVCCWRQFTQEVSLLTHEYAGTLWSNVGPNISRSAGPHDSWRPRGRTTGSGGTALDLLSCAASILSSSHRQPPIDMPVKCDRLIITKHYPNNYRQASNNGDL